MSELDGALSFDDSDDKTEVPGTAVELLGSQIRARSGVSLVSSRSKSKHQVDFDMPHNEPVVSEAQESTDKSV